MCLNFDTVQAFSDVRQNIKICLNFIYSHYSIIDIRHVKKILKGCDHYAAAPKNFIYNR